MTNSQYIVNAITGNAGNHKVINHSITISLDEAEANLKEQEENKTKLFSLNCVVEGLFELSEQSGLKLVYAVCNAWNIDVSIGLGRYGMEISYKDQLRNAARNRYVVIECTGEDSACIEDLVKLAWNELTDAKKACHVTRLLFDMQVEELAKQEAHIEWLKTER
jgi:hypothetical protein